MQKGTITMAKARTVSHADGGMRTVGVVAECCAECRPLALLLSGRGVREVRPSGGITL
jgi:hypothetical protein